MYGDISCGHARASIRIMRPALPDKNESDITCTRARELSRAIYVHRVALSIAGIYKHGEGVPT